MIARVEAAGLRGIDALPVEVEVDVGRGLPAFQIVGLPDAACRESQVRVLSAIRNSGFCFPPKKILINLAPADVRKEGAGFDLAIAIGILIASGQVEAGRVSECVYSGELALDGRVRGVTGALARAAGYADGRRFYLFSADNEREVTCMPGARPCPVRTLLDAVEMTLRPRPATAEPFCRVESRRRFRPDLADVRGQRTAKRAIEIACAGGHNLLMIGPPGSGKTMLAKRIPGLLPDLDQLQSVEVTKIHSVAGTLRKRDALIRTPPFRSPHHTISDSALVGGGAGPKPGEISLAHHGVLFMDELPEFRRNVLEALRQPLEEGRVIVSRSAGTCIYPSQFMLVAAMNPCPCGYFTDSRQPCSCTPLQIRNYMGRVSGPLLDRIDMHLTVNRLQVEDFDARGGGGAGRGEGTQVVRERIEQARRVQESRYGRAPGARFNAHVDGAEVEAHCRPDDTAANFLTRAMEELNFSARAYHKILKVARTIADLAGSSVIGLPHVQEAVQYRTLDRNRTT